MKIPQKNIGTTDSILSIAGLSIILGVTMILYWPVTGFGWITGLDQELLIDNRLVYQFSAASVMDMFLSTTAGRYQPLTFLSYSIDIGIAGDSAIRTIHMVNLVLHLLNITLFFRLIQLLSRKLIPALIAGLIFALHPLSLDAVAWLSGRSILLCAFFTLLALISYVYYQRHQKYRHLSTFLFLLALLSNPMALLFPLALLWMDPEEKKTLKSALSGHVVVLVMSLFYILIAAISADSQMVSVSGGLLMPYSAGLFLIKFFVPLCISGIYPLSFQEGIWGTYASAYIPLMGLSAFTGWGIYKLYSIFVNQRLRSIGILLLSACWLSLTAWISFDRLPDWKDSGIYWTRIVELYPEDHQAYFHRADYWAMNAEFDRAKFDYNMCISLNNQAYEAMNNLGLIYLQERSPDLALKEFSKSISINDQFYKAHLNAGLTFMRLGKNMLAMESMNRAIALNPDEPLAYYNRGLIFERDNYLDEAIADFSRAIRLDPFRYVFYKDRGKALVWKQRFEEAEQDFSRALEFDPADPEMWFRRSLARVSQNKFGEGLEDALRAQSMGYPVTEDYIKGLTVQILEADSIRME